MKKRTQRQMVWWMITVYAIAVIGAMLAFASKANSQELITDPTSFTSSVSNTPSHTNFRSPACAQ